MGVLGLGSLLLSGAAAAQDDAAAKDPRCLRLRQIEHTTIVDQRTVLFEMRGDTVYRNDLPQRCPGLVREQRFLYRVTMDQLCNTDLITILEDWGFAFTPGTSCRLGDFVEIDRQEADALIASSRRGRRSRDRD
jgi:hypothetical protein